ncbi:3-oxoacyl-ACP synthase [Wenyingzhuangia sp. chi5]|uniref:3-oxoacyl-ACP synthase n=1 Tax=Wenyingzhuangia gilva TaxID=3057677 RepID=A0ABT8VPF9_9FLAO|nr:3-oxoacyl-ACP synthase [Wenyingzhuangia sp. chi5]MDO3693847.1 3-oxoacyl-ACP synthase [Wenyingzhuangia sp. chi5]
MKVNKEELLTKCIRIIDEKLENIQQAINGYQQDLNSETKSSAGDKHETGRAMLQLEMEKLGQQYQTVLSQKNSLRKIETSAKNKAQIGSLVVANGGYYFLATSIGQVKYEGKTFMVISINSPIGQLLLGKQKDDCFTFNGKQLKIDEVL